FDSERGRLGSGVAAYPVLRRPGDSEYAAQRHADHLTALVSAARQAIAAASIDARQIAALGIDTTGSTIVPVDEKLQPLDDYYLWCDHRGWREAAEITRAAHQQGLAAIDWCGGTYSSEFGWAKLWHWLRHNPNKRSKFVTAVEHCDLIVAVLCGITDPDKLPRSICAMGHKWMWNETLGGLPSDEFLSAVDPILAGVRQRMTGNYARSDTLAGTLAPYWAEQLGLSAGIPIPIGALDAHWDAIGAGIRLGDIVNVIGTSTCVMAISDKLAPIPGVFGVVAGSIHPSYAGIEAGLSAAGDIFEAIARRAGATLAELSQAVNKYQAGQTGLLRLVWDHGDRTVLAQPHLRGVTFGWNLTHSAADELFAAMEGTAFHTRIILDRLTEHRVPIQRVIHAGGIPRRSPVINRIYASALNVPILLPKDDTTSLGSAIFAFLAAGTFSSVEQAQQALCPAFTSIDPDPHSAEIYSELFAHYRALYFALGSEHSEPVPLGTLLPALRQIANRAGHPPQSPSAR
ncbi:MAG TPA: ribulokinase, partial [Pirellulaceae bacterium]|nr:ribulokinase [Pirellulaceae bacterium]